MTDPSINSGQAKSKTALREEEILKFWKAEGIFEKTLNKEAPKGEFVFYDGPPFATGLPHYGSLLSSVIKDVIPRYKTMQGFRVRRRWGWDTHGLPIESLVEKKLELKTKKDIEKIGVAKFNHEARNMVLQYARDWEKYVERVGRWVEFENAYKTMDNSYIESVWWAISEMNKKGLLYEGRKVLMYCPHCETPLAKAEIAMDNSYKDVTEEAVTVEFRLKGEKNKSILAWTTTPWTLPGNVALAVGEDVDYVEISKKDMGVGDEVSFILAKDRLEITFGGQEYKIQREIKGKNLVGLEYEPLFDVPKIKESEKAYRVYAGDFVNTEEGTGIVHTAVMYGEDDFNLGVKEDLPMVDMLDAGGKYNENAPEFLRGKYIKKAESDIKDYLDKENFIFERKNNTHSYPHCYRCGTPLIYNAVSSWFVNIQKIKKELLSLNEEINWVPEHLKHGRFGNSVENAPDWTISRNRFWASPLPIWKNEKGEVVVVSGIEDLKNKTKKSGNKYFTLRHGEAEQNIKDIINSELINNSFHLTEKGKAQVSESAEKIKEEKINLIITSPFLRCVETAEIVRNALGLEASDVLKDERLVEFKKGPGFEGKSWDKYWNLFENTRERFEKSPDGGENLLDLNKRAGQFLYDIEKKYSNKNILIVTHAGVVTAMHMVAEGAGLERCIEMKDENLHASFAEFARLYFVPLPHDENYELDLHKPYIDEIELVDEDGNGLKRISEVVDCWLESGSMPFAEWNYPFSNKDEFEKRFPGDFIAEYIAQTRTWFYYMHVISTALFSKNSFKNVVTTGNVLASDGSKMSKSKGNYTDPLANLDQLGADALRLYLMGSVVMQAEDMSFKDEEYKENHNRVINILWNCLTFFDTYADSNIELPHKLEPKNVLDKWVISRLNQTIGEITESMDKYDTVKTVRPIKSFVDDFSTWFLRRSRERFKSEDIKEKEGAIITTRFTLVEFSKTIAPIMPFLAESIYQKVKSEKDPESVHLCEWFTPSTIEGPGIDKEVLQNMEEVRRVVSLALEKRNAAGIKVRQPLNELRIKNYELRGKEEYLNLIKDEVNIKEVVFDENIEGEVELDTEITEELKREGNVREFVRAVQALRKEKGLVATDAIILKVETDEKGKGFLEANAEQIKKPTNVLEIKFEINNGRELRFGEFELKIKIG